MTKEEQHNYLLRFRRFQQSREKIFAPKFFKALKNQYKVVIDNIDMGVSAIHQISSDEIYKILITLYIDAGTVYGAKVRADLNSQKARMPIGFSERMQELIKQYFQFDLLNLSEKISDTTKKLIMEVFTNAYAQGLGINDIIQQLENTEMSRIRSRLIARTETVAAANSGALIVAKDSGLLLNKTWLATYDSRTRHDHAEINGHTVGRDDYFDVGGFEMLHPGDKGGHGKPAVDIKELANCRCTTIFEPLRDANGRVIRN